MSRGLRLAAGLALGIALAAGAARAAGPIALPSSDVPNLPGVIVLPPAWTSPPAQPEQLSYAQLSAIWHGAGAAYGVQWQVLAAINKVESNFGRNMGPSSAGAIGWMQFMPSTWLRWGLDADGDGIADPWRAEDAVYSAARYLAASGGRSDVSGAVYSYNHAQWYVDEVLSLARLFHDGGAGATMAIDRLQGQLVGASQAVVTASRDVVSARGRAQALARVEARFARRADTAPLLSDRLAARKQAVLLDVRRRALLAGVAAARSRLAAAQRRLASARASSRAASFSPGARSLLASPSYGGGAAGNYVFPVGGGPGVVFASHTHHDYPAVDIAAPAGEPVYALANAVVLRAWGSPDPRCGIGLTLRASDGQTWTYCHLAVLEPAAHAGAALAAGTLVGLVGQTGDASGPHLHLQLQPPTSWPQQQAWFQSFAGSAFTWSDGPTARTTASAAPAPPRAIFAVVPGTRRPPANQVVAFTR